MAKIKKTNHSWVKYKKDLLKDDKIREIFEFYLLQCPYDSKSFMGIDITGLFKKYKLSSNGIKDYLLESVNLYANSNFAVAKTLDEVGDKAKNHELYTNFPNKISRVRAVLFNNCKSIVMSLLYSIRCGLAHGSFKVESLSDIKFLALENFNNKEKCVGARLILSIDSLVDLKKRILGGDKEFENYTKNKDERIIKNAQNLLAIEEVCTQNDLRKKVGISYKLLNNLCQKYSYKIIKVNNRYQIRKTKHSK